MSADADFVLVHGAGLGAWIWERLLQHLPSPALAVDLPGRGANPAPRSAVGMHAAVRSLTAEVADWTEDPVVLVGHSLGAMVALGAASQLGDRVRRVVLVGGGVGRSGASYFAVLPTRVRIPLRLVTRLRIPAPRAAIRRTLCNDLDADTAALVASRTKLPEPRRMYTEPVSWDAIPASVPLTYVKLLRDRAVSPDLQDRFATNLGRAKVVTLDTGHLPMLGKPEDLAAVLTRTLA
ncbi:MAG: alpha/beta fold hydrolase [Acidimicrobiia bacterium]